MDFDLPPLAISLEDDPPPRDLQSILNGLLSFNRPLEPESNHTPIAVYMRDAEGRLRGGLTGALYFNALFIDYLWVDAPLRRQGIGRTLLARVEHEARTRGRDFAHIESMSFQAPAFYLARGYSAYALLDGYTEGAARVHLRHQFAATHEADAAVNPAHMALGLRVEVTTEPDAADLRTVREGLFAWNAQVYQPDNPRPLYLFLRGPDGQVLGGLTGSTYWNACFVDLFGLDVGVRRKGFGTAIMQAAVEEATRRGCDFIHLDTLNFQARGFYEKLGFNAYGTLDGFAAGVERYHMVKYLRTRSTATVTL